MLGRDEARYDSIDDWSSTSSRRASPPVWVDLFRAA